MQKKIILFILLLVMSNFFYSQSIESKRKYIDSIVAKADTIFLVFADEIAYSIAEVPIYLYQIDKNKFKNSEQVLFDTLKDGRLKYKNLPKTYERSKNSNSITKNKLLLFENGFYGSTTNNINNQIIGFEERLYINSKNNYSNYIFYHSNIKCEFSTKYLDYVRFRDQNYKSYEVRYSGYSPNVESGALSFTYISDFLKGKNYAMFSIGKNSKKSNNLSVKINIEDLNAVLKRNKIYYINSESSNEEKLLFKEYKFQKYISD